VFAASLSAGSSTQVGIGASVATVAQQFTQGNISTSSSTLDLAVNGQGFFRMSDNGSITYTRNGQFHVDKNGYVVNSSGLRLTGNTFDAKGLPNGVGGDIRLSYGDADPKATTEAGYNVNLDSRPARPRRSPSPPSTAPASRPPSARRWCSPPPTTGSPSRWTAKPVPP
jgi:flagellar hook protein FlgE